jgi:hypothetical protein
MDANTDTAASGNRNPSPSPGSAPPGGPKGPSPRRGLTAAVLGAALLTLLVVLGAARRTEGGGRPVVRSAVPAVPVAVPGPTTPDPQPPVSTPPPAPIAQAPARPQVELVFALDTTSSMSGLIEGAKRKIWSLASFVAHGQPTPDLRVGLVGYRDVGDEYVTKVYDLDADLDRVYARLRAFKAEGGGDVPEHVARALDESVRKMSWSQSPSVLKIIYLVGDAPPHTDYADGYDVGRSARVAKAKGIQVHTIECGTADDTELMWRRIATLGGGQFMAIRQDGGMHEQHTRYDDELAALHDKLADTTVAYGKAGPDAAAASRVARAAPAAVKAERASFLARKGKAVAGEGDLLEGLASGAVKLDEVQADLPADLRGMDREKQAAAIAGKQKQREELAQRIEKLSKLRDAELEAKEAAAEKAGAGPGMDTVAKSALKKAAKDNARAGVSF